MIGKAEINILGRVKGYFSRTMGNKTLKKGEVSVDWSLEKVLKK